MQKRYYDSWLYQQPKKKKSKKKTNLIKYKRLIKKSKDLQKNTPQSEIWFKSLYISHSDDKFNEPLGVYIPDIQNKTYKYVIEIDGSIHSLNEVKERDKKKDEYYTKRFYKIFRIQAYDLDSFDKFIKEYNEYINLMNEELNFNN